jgi:cytochrome P450
MGNLIAVGEKCNPANDRHPDYGFEEIWNELGQPSAYTVDLAPVELFSFLVICDPQLCEQIVQPSDLFKYSTPKSDTMAALKPLIGKESIITAETEEWKDLRKRFNRGFAPAHLHNLSPLIITKTDIFVKRIQEAAKSGKVVAMKDFAQDLTTDIITQLAIEKDFESQSIPEGVGPKSMTGILTASRMLSNLIATSGQGFDMRAFLDPVRRFKAWYYERLFDRELYSILEQKLKQEELQPKKKDSSAKAIVQLALAGLDPSPALLWNTVAQIKSFLFAGQDTTASLIQWLTYELSKANYDPRSQEIVRKLEAEHDAVFGPGAYSALDVLKQPGKAEELLGSKLPYTTAFIKETLRIHPPAGTARIIPEPSATIPPVYADIEGKHAQINGLRIYNCQYLVHRNPKVWGPDAHVFNPDRWLDEEYMSKLPPGAWRPFERGPRNCIGQELAMLEGKVVLAAVTRGLRFEKVGLTGRNGEKEVFQTQQVTAVPFGGMTMRFHLKE